jgi:hypothetical protein
MSGGQTIAIEDAGDEIVAGDQDESSDRGDDIGRRPVALSTTPSWQPQLGVGAAHPMDQEHDLGRVDIEIGDHFADHGAHDALLQPRVGRGRGPDSLEVLGEGGEGHGLVFEALRCHGIMIGDPRLDLADPCERAIPARLQLRRDQAVLRVGEIVLSEGPLDGVPGRLEIADHRFARLIAPAGGVWLGLDRPAATAPG